MAKYYHIRWQDKDLKELERAVRNFNAKISRLAKSNASLKNVLPEKVSKRELKELINTRSDLIRELNALKRFSKRGAEDLVKAPLNENEVFITKWQKEELNRRVGIINRRRKARALELGKLEATSRGEKLGYTVGQRSDYVGMGSIRDVALQPMKSFTRYLTPKEIRMRYKSTIYQSQSDYYTKRDYELRDNFIKGLLENYNPSDISDIIKNIKQMDIEDFLEKFYQEGATFEFASPDGLNEMKFEEYESYVEALKSTWT